MRLMTSVREKPAGPEMRAFHTSAMPPRPSRSTSGYLPNCTRWLSTAVFTSTGPSR